MPEFIYKNSTRIAKYGHGDQIIVGLHGWAGGYTDLEVFGKWIDPDQFTLYAIEMPGRGNTDPLGHKHDNDAFVNFLKVVVDSLDIHEFTLICDSGFSQVGIKFACKNESIKGILFIYAPVISPQPPNFAHSRLWVKPSAFIFSHVRIFDWLINMLRNSDKIMHGVFIRSTRPEAIELELLDIANKRNANLEAIFQHAWSILNTNLEEEWKNLGCKIEVIIAEKDEIFDTMRELKYLRTNSNANITVVEEHNHNWDDEFIEIMRERLSELLKK